MTGPVVWFDIPTTHLDRAIRFYSAVLGKPVRKEVFTEMAIGLFPHAEGELGGCLYQSIEDRPSSQGPLLYWDCGGRLDDAIAAVEPNGGRVLKPKHPIGPYGFRAVVLDSEGNRVALHSS